LTRLEKKVCDKIIFVKILAFADIFFRHNKIMRTKSFWKTLYQKKLRFFLFVSFIIGVLGFALDKIFPLFLESSPAQIVIAGHQKLTKEEILKWMGVTRSSRIRDLKVNELEKNLLKHPRIKDATVVKRSNVQILVTIRERKASFIVNANDALYEVDQEGKILSIDDVRDTSVCVLSGEFLPEQGYFRSTPFLDLAKSVARVFKMYPELKERISEFQVQKTGGILVYIQAPKKIRVLLGNNLDNIQVRKLYAALAYFESQNVAVKILDLRGDDAVFQ